VGGSSLELACGARDRAASTTRLEALTVDEIMNLPAGDDSRCPSARPTCCHGWRSKCGRERTGRPYFWHRVAGATGWASRQAGMQLHRDGRAHFQTTVRFSDETGEPPDAWWPSSICLFSWSVHRRDAHRVHQLVRPHHVFITASDFYAGDREFQFITTVLRT